MSLSSIKAPASLLKAQKLANLLDNAITIPFTKFKFGLDFLIGLLPFAGDLVSLLLSLKIVHYAKQLGLPRLVQAQMLKNVALDFIIGLIPFLGDIADVFYRANQKNVRIMERWWVSQQHGAIKANSQQQLKDWQDKQL
ncbi:MAG: DUF4112 domain-containing protein [Paraglaciecola sp.]|uniref:DUF4112 domain-containing protein n=1 Tax=Paraglaciecola sp. TaxID=1920173 RepID=UPI00273E040B|nr:DUF4112 domain-containing protein [Paraglaciecola sp.]MDP5029258.1 DUF4112 domain-containing protein [Paraglaciecola sp.]MDP5040197.1 DUF4112 domain-containing protein [Paraglaciecola sp.]MDP5129516.1 DUF4112 domain-containing protein [Paraglaciecola sp.]